MLATLHCDQLERGQTLSHFYIPSLLQKADHIIEEDEEGQGNIYTIRCYYVSYGKIKFYLYSQGKVCSEKGEQRTIVYDWEHLEVFMEEGEKISRLSQLEKRNGNSASKAKPV